MARQLRYRGIFASRKQMIWDVYIFQEADEPFDVEEMTFDGDEPVIISWDKKDKEDVICGSSATLKVISETDGKYRDLYTINAGEIGIEIHYDGVLYWMGTLDAEFYEEPYAMKENYLVTLTFSDFGVLDRMKFDMTGTPSVMDYVTRAMEVAKIDCPVEMSDVSSYVRGAERLVDGIRVEADNFTDEDGEVSTWMEAIDAVMQPLALRMVQQRGQVHIYDINGVWTRADHGYEYDDGKLAPEVADWCSDDCELSADKVANSVTIAFSPYSEDEIDTISMNYKGEEDETTMPDMMDNSQSLHADRMHRFYHHALHPLNDDNYEDFIMLFSDDGGNVKNTGSMFFKVKTMLGNTTEYEGIVECARLWEWQDPTDKKNNKGNLLTFFFPREKLWHDEFYTALDDWIPTNLEVFKTRGIRINIEEKKNKYILLKMDALISAKVNPFTDSDKDNKDDEDALKEGVATFFIPTMVEIVNDEGDTIMHFTNENTVTQADARGFRTGTWKEGPATDLYNLCWLQYFDKSGYFGGMAAGKWVTNRNAVGLWPTENINFGRRFGGLSFTSMQELLPDGEFIPYPTGVQGKLIVTVLSGLYAYNQYNLSTRAVVFRGSWGSLLNDGDETWKWRNNKWLLFKDMKVEFVDGTKITKSAKLDDIDYTGTINEAAKDDIHIDTMCGVHPKHNIFAKGCYKNAEGYLLKAIMRAGIEDVPERLLIRTLTSQYNRRHNIFKGTINMNIDSSAWSTGLAQTYRMKKTFNKNEEKAYYIVVEEEQNLVEETSEVTLCEITPDTDVEY